MYEGISGILPATPGGPPFPMATAFWDPRLILTASFATASLEDDLNALNAANPASQGLVEPNFVSRDDNEEDERLRAIAIPGVPH